MSASTGIGIAARAPRQSGLKKPRPLRSVSFQDSVTEKRDCDVKGFQRQCSEGSAGQASMAVEGAEGQQIVMCKEIAAMSARVASAAASEADGRLSMQAEFYNPERQYVLHHKVNKHESSLTSTLCDESRSPLPGKKTLVDCNSNNISLPDVEDEFCSNSFSFDQYRRNELNCSFSSDSSRHSSQDSFNSGKAQVADLDISRSLLSLNKGDETSISPRSGKTGAIAVATLATDKGDDLVLTSRNMKTILFAARVLLREMKARVIKIEQMSDPDPESATSEVQKSPFAETPAQAAGESISRKSREASSDLPDQARSQKRRYSKAELLELSRSSLSKQTPALWNVLSRTCADVCLPADKVMDYFDPDFFEHHDGGLVVDSSKFRRERYD